ncbi:MAG: AarF/ABC1/UbiB kinase family protein, partial [Okeania sp. SIO2H7]|nr:AarF/ABC1/UbiB kinase family protein [Okeania sp. SIO2H7]
MQYDPIALSNYYRQRPQQVWRRRLAITNEFSIFGMGLMRDWIGRRVDQNQRQRARKFTEKLTRLGATFIKLGQILSCRPDLVPPIYIEELANLQDQLPPFDNAIAHSIINSELGYYYWEVFAELSDRPVAAASFGQVYKGKLKSGEAIAVKVQRPDLEETISLDIYILRRFAARVQASFPIIRSDLVALIDEVAARLFEEMDYTQEGRNAEKFANLYGGNILHIAVE